MKIEDIRNLLEPKKIIIIFVLSEYSSHSRSEK